MCLCVRLFKEKACERERERVREGEGEAEKEERQSCLSFAPHMIQKATLAVFFSTESNINTVQHQQEFLFFPIWH